MIDEDRYENKEEDGLQTTVPYSELIEQHAFLGKYPYDTIMECIRAQFEDYINNDDPNDYVDIFYNQLEVSYDSLKANSAEEHPTEIKEALDKITDRFIAEMSELFETRLTISVADVFDDEGIYEDKESVFRKLYSFFILGAKRNFKTVISNDIFKRIKISSDPEMVDDDKYFKFINAAIEDYSPLCINITPAEFLAYCKDDEIIEMFDEGKFFGNFLRKYSPKLYQNEEFQIDIINFITTMQRFVIDTNASAAQ